MYRTVGLYILYARNITLHPRFGPEVSSCNDVSLTENECELFDIILFQQRPDCCSKHERLLLEKFGKWVDVSIENLSNVPSHSKIFSKISPKLTPIFSYAFQHIELLIGKQLFVQDPIQAQGCKYFSKFHCSLAKRPFTQYFESMQSYFSNRRVLDIPVTAVHSIGQI